MKRGVSLVLVFFITLSILNLPTYASAEISKNPQVVITNTITSSKNTKSAKEYFKITTPKNKKYIIYVSGRVKKNVLYIPVSSCLGT